MPTVKKKPKLISPLREKKAAPAQGAKPIAPVKMATVKKFEGVRTLRMLTDSIELPDKYVSNIADLYCKSDDVRSDFGAIAYATCRATLFNRVLTAMRSAIPNMKEAVPDHKKILSDELYDKVLEEQQELLPYAQVRVQGKEFIASVPVLYLGTTVNDIVDFVFESRMTNSDYAPIRQAVNDAFMKWVSTDLPELFSISESMNKAMAFTPGDLAFAASYISGREISTRMWTLFQKACKGWRMVGPPLGNVLRGQFEFKSATKPGPDAPDYQLHLNPKNLQGAAKSEFMDRTLTYRLNKSPQGSPCVLCVDMAIPYDMARYLTQMDKPSPQYVTMWVANWIRNVLTYQVGTGGDTIRPISSIAADVEQAHPMARQPRMNADGLAIDSDGDLIVVPVADAKRANEFSKIFESNLINPETETCHFVDYGTLKGMQKVIGDDSIAAERPSRNHSLPNRVLYTDWLNRKLSYTNGDGLFAIEDLEGVVPASNADLIQYMHMPLDDDSRRHSTIISALLPFITRIADYVEDGDADAHYGSRADFDDLIRASASDPKTWLKSVQRSVISNIRGNPAGMVKRFGEDVNQYLSEMSWNFSLIRPNSPVSVFRPLARQLKAEAERANRNVLGFFDEANYSVPNEMRRIAVIKLLGSVTADYDRIFREDRNERIVFLKQKQMPDDYTPRKTPMVDGLSLLPHQLKIDYNCGLNAKVNILDVDAGGGKTISILNDISNKLGEGILSLPLVLCPGHLVANYIEDANYAFKGKFNIIPITTDTIKTYGVEYFIGLANAELPKNTILVSDYDFLKSGAREVSYGMNVVTVSRNAEVLRLFGCDGVYLDESHYLANKNSQRNNATQRVIADIPNITLATGTFLYGQLTDVVGQMAMIAPSLFGNKQDFIDKYANQVAYGKPVDWVMGAEEEIAKLIRTRCVMTTVKRREWAALLPRKKERFLVIDNMTDNQKSVYLAILKETLEEIKSNKELMDSLLSADEGEAENLEFLLRPYLQRLEMFLTAPADDEGAGHVLKLPEDRIGPKAKMVTQIIQEHIKKAIPGKILVFTSYLKSARAIYEALPPDLKEQAILYSAEEKTKHLVQFKKDPNKKILIGVEFSLNTGLNLQFVTRLIRNETVWNPGTVEQGESRLFRPDPKVADSWKRKIYMDWIVCNNTIDITKTARLVSKTLVKAKFDNLANPKYQEIPALPLVSMTLDNILTMNSFGDTLSSYLQAFDTMREVQRNEFDEWRAKTKHLNPVPITPGKPLENAGFMSKVPYIQGMTLPLQDKLGLVTLSDYAIEHGKGDERDIGAFDPTGKPVHTEYGDGVVVSSRSGTVRVKLDTGGKSISVSKLKCFVRLRPPEGGKFVRGALRALTGLPGVLTSSLTKIPEDTAQPGQEKLTPNAKPADRADDAEHLHKPIPNSDFKLDGKVNLYLSIVNNTIALGIDQHDPDLDLDLAKRAGFQLIGKYLYATIPNFYAYTNFVALLKKRFKVEPEYAKQLSAFERVFAKGKARLMDAKMAATADIRNFYIQHRKPVPDGFVRPYPVVQDGEVFVMFALRTQPAAAQIRNVVKVPGVRYDVSAGELWSFYPNKDAVLAAVEAMRARGLKVRNIVTFKKQLQEVRLIKTATPAVIENVDEEVNDKPKKSGAVKPKIQVVMPFDKKGGKDKEVKKATKPTKPAKKATPEPKKSAPKKAVKKSAPVKVKTKEKVTKKKQVKSGLSMGMMRLRPLSAVSFKL